MPLPAPSKSAIFALAIIAAINVLCTSLALAATDERWTNVPRLSDRLPEAQQWEYWLGPPVNVLDIIRQQLPKAVVADGAGPLALCPQLKTYIADHDNDEAWLFSGFCATEAKKKATWFIKAGNAKSADTARAAGAQLAAVYDSEVQRQVFAASTMLSVEFLNGAASSLFIAGNDSAAVDILLSSKYRQGKVRYGPELCNAYLAVAMARGARNADQGYELQRYVEDKSAPLCHDRAIITRCQAAIWQWQVGSAQPALLRECSAYFHQGLGRMVDFASAMLGTHWPYNNSDNDAWLVMAQIAALSLPSDLLEQHLLLALENYRCGNRTSAGLNQVKKITQRLSPASEDRKQQVQRLRTGVPKCTEG
jgi:hypothetical protein